MILHALAEDGRPVGELGLAEAPLTMPAWPETPPPTTGKTAGAAPPSTA